jgi:hypothetical protein
MRMMCMAIWAVAFALAGCLSRETDPPVIKQSDDRIIAWPNNWSDHLGQVVTVEGTAADAKMGAFLQGNGKEIWIADLDQWPEGFYAGGDNTGKRIRATGMVIKRDDLPVFIPKLGVYLQGIPVQSEEELEKARWRFLLKDAKWSTTE